ncbi:hypothetical protein GALMADRAFT_231484 [Galerina marginata CBS 339.88]|uniref:Uncharacterized protein n=1 Tax=Galerina marginata (strain CBS 339.88) TaxID=685588 RepID=A0A067SBJ4_GALM3|nr:hypothetical protein GALMADRAFT_231484 [Galerina marginata CBS 339.88]
MQYPLRTARKKYARPRGEHLGCIINLKNKKAGKNKLSLPWRSEEASYRRRHDLNNDYSTSPLSSSHTVVDSKKNFENTANSHLITYHT